MAYLAKTVLLNQSIGEDTFVITFTYEDVSEVVVEVNNVQTTAFTWINSSTIQLNTPLTEVSNVEIYRVTDLSSRSVDFQNAAELDEIDLDNANIQLFNKMQEITDTQEDNLHKEPDGSVDMNGKRITNLAEPVDDTDAATKQSILALTSSQVAAAQAAQTAAELAQAAAELAENGADASAIAAANSEAAAAASAAAAAISEANAAASAAASAAAATYENLNANGDVGTGADQVAQGNHGHTNMLKSDTTSNLTVGFTTDRDILGNSSGFPTPHTLVADLTKPEIKDTTISGNLTINEPSGNAGGCVIYMAIDSNGPYNVTLGPGMIPIGNIPKDLAASKVYQCKIIKYVGTVNHIEIVEAG